MTRPVPKRRVTLGREFRNSVKAGPRVWSIVALAFLCIVVVPLLSKLATLLVIVLIAAGLFFIGPVIARAVIAGLIARAKQAVVFRMFTEVGGVVPASAEGSRAGDPLPHTVSGPGRRSQADVIEVEAVTEEKKTPVLRG